MLALTTLCSFSCWIDLRGGGLDPLSWSRRPGAEATLSRANIPHSPPTSYLVRDDDTLQLGNEIVGKVVQSPPAILDAVRAGVYEVILLDSFDVRAVSFALDRSRACARISGIKVRVAARVDSVEQIDLLLENHSSSLILVIPADADETVWIRAQQQHQQQKNV